MDELKLQSRTEQLACKIGHIGWGYIFIYLDINLGTIDILPSWAGYLMILSSLAILSEYVSSAGLLRNIGILLAGWAAFDWFVTIFGVVPSGGFGLLFSLAGTMAGIITIYFHFQMLTNLSEIAGQLKLEDHRIKLLKLRTINTILHTILTIVSSLSFLETIMWLVMGLAILNFINTIRINFNLFDLKQTINLKL